MTYTLTDTKETIFSTTPEQNAAYDTIGETYSELAKAILSIKLHTLTGLEELECRTAAGEDTGRMGFNCDVIDQLATQFAKEISIHQNQS